MNMNKEIYTPGFYLNPALLFDVFNNVIERKESIISMDNYSGGEFLHLDVKLDPQNVEQINRLIHDFESYNERYRSMCANREYDPKDLSHIVLTALVEDYNDHHGNDGRVYYDREIGKYMPYGQFVSEE